MTGYLLAEGKRNCQTAEEIANSLTRWIVIKDVVAGRDEKAESFLTIIFECTPHFIDHLKQKKIKIQEKR